MESETLLLSLVAWGLAIAVLAGLLFYVISKLYNNKKVATSLKRDYAIFERELLFVTKSMINYSFDNLEKPPIAMAQTYDAIASRRIDLYHKHLKNERNELDNMKKFKDSFLNYSTTSKDLNSKLTHLINLHIGKDSKEEIYVRYVYMYFMGQLLNLPDHETLPLTDIPTETINQILKVHAKILHNELLIRICREYLDKKKEVEDDYEIVRSQLQHILR